MEGPSSARNKVWLKAEDFRNCWPIEHAMKIYAIAGPLVILWLVAGCGTINH